MLTEHWLSQRVVSYKSMKTISLIIPIFNTQEYLEKCLESAINQDYRNIEIICVDDGSTDNSGRILDDFAGKYKTIVAIHQENGGESNARNRGLSVARGDYIGFMDCDDWIEPGMYSRLKDAMEAYDVDMVASGWIKEFPGRSITVSNQGQVKCGVMNQNELLRYVYHRDNYQGFAYMWNKLYKREALCGEDGNFLKFPEDLKLGGDIVYLAQILMNVKSAVYMEESFYHYRQRSGSGSHSKNMEAWLDCLTAYDRVIAFFQHNFVGEEILNLVKRFQVYHSTNIAEMAFQSHNKEGLGICQDYMRRYEKEYVETNQTYKDRIDRFYRILKYEV